LSAGFNPQISPISPIFVIVKPVLSVGQMRYLKEKSHRRMVYPHDMDEIRAQRPQLEMIMNEVVKSVDQ